MELTIPASPAHLAGLRHAARHALREVPPQIADELVLALDEAATNAILYGSRGGDPVQVAVWVRDGWVEATVVDHGPAQPPHPPPTTDRLSSRGRGLWLLDRLVDEVRVERAALGTRVTLRRRIRSPNRPGEVVGSLRRVARSADPGVRRQRGLRYGRVLAKGAARGQRPPGARRDPA